MMLNSLLDNMMSTFTDPFSWIIYGIFVSQIVIISFYLPRKWRQFRKELFENHPQSEYPKLYYQPFEVELKRQKIRKTLDQSIALLSILVFIDSLSHSYSAVQVTKTMFLLSIVQLLPFMLSQYWGRKNSQLMQKMPQPQKRVTLLAARKLTDFVPLTTLVVAAVSYFISISLGLFVYWDTVHTTGAFDLKSWSLFTLLLLNTLVTIYVVVLMNKALFEKREDQNLSDQDRLFFIRKKIKQLISTIILYSLFIFALFLFKLMGWGMAAGLIMTSVYLQVILLIRVNPTLERDFSVYRADPEID